MHAARRRLWCFHHPARNCRPLLLGTGHRQQPVASPIIGEDRAEARGTNSSDAKLPERRFLRDVRFLCPESDRFCQHKLWVVGKGLKLGRYALHGLRRHIFAQLLHIGYIQ